MLQTENLLEAQGKVQIGKVEMFIFKICQCVAFFLLVVLLVRDILTMTEQEQNAEKLCKVIKPSIHRT